MTAPEMNCSEASARLEAYHDSELALDSCLALEEHLAACPACNQRFAALRLQSSRIRIELPRHAAPASLRRSIESLLPAVEKAPAGPAARWRWAVPAAFAVAVLLGAGLWWQRGAETEATSREAVAAHSRAMMNGRQIEVASSDQHTVKPWFGTRVDFAPPVKDYAEAGFALAGGRVDYLGERRVAALAYRQREHLIDVFVWPVDASGDRLPAVATLRGFNIVHFQRGRMAYWLVSDLNGAELGRLAALIHEQKQEAR